MILTLLDNLKLDYELHAPDSLVYRYLDTLHISHQLLSITCVSKIIIIIIIITSSLVNSYLVLDHQLSVVNQ